VPVGFSPIGIAYDPDTGGIYVADYYGTAVSVISDATNEVVDSVGVGHSPAGVAYDSARGEVFVTDSGSNSVSVISADAPAASTSTQSSTVQSPSSSSNSGSTSSNATSSSIAFGFVGIVATDAALLLIIGLLVARRAKAG
jgi:YVTN family beta-propeller protein